jgi:hypothetical protein
VDEEEEVMVVVVVMIVIVFMAVMVVAIIIRVHVMGLIELPASKSNIHPVCMCSYKGYVDTLSCPHSNYTDVPLRPNNNACKNSCYTSSWCWLH